MNFYCVELPYQPDAARNYYAALKDLPWSVWLDSGGMARFDIITAMPQRTFLKNEENFLADPFIWAREALEERVESIPDIPFAGGVLGYWGYDLSQKMYALHEVGKEGSRLPDLAIGLYDWALVLDHQLHTTRLVSHQRFEDTGNILHEVMQRLKSPPSIFKGNFKVHGKIASNFTPESYANAFGVVQDYLKCGDCYQVNLAQCFSATATGSALGAYYELRSISPAPYSAFLNLPNLQILCASPERFLQVRNGVVETKPIKGTRARSSDVQLDRELAEELRYHTKDRAENLMIVDLMRNDIGKNCVPGTVCVPKLFEVESFSNVHHLISTVTGRLAEKRDALDLLRDCFPGGSVTGAPKQRAMQIIEQLEPTRRGIYCGAIGYVGFDGNMDSNIVIRTMVYANGRIRCWAGGGIVADSDMAAEYQETMDKLSAMIKVLQMHGGIV